MILSLETTNACNLRCLHCMRDKLEDRRFIPLDVVQKVLREAKTYGIWFVSLTGGEPTLHPQLEELLETIAGEDFNFRLITNGFQFKSKVLPILLRPHIKKHLQHVSISLDGATAKTHDANRGEGAFKTSMEMLSLCKLKEIPFNLMTVVNNFNKSELTDIALLGSSLGTLAHFFGPLHVTPSSIREAIVPPPDETKRLMSFITRTLVKELKVPIVVGSGAYCSAPLIDCNVFKGELLHVDFLGNAIFCCTVTHPTDEGKPDDLGEEVLADLKCEPLGTAIVRQRLLIAKMIEERVRAHDAGTLSELDHFPCHWCFERFGKLGWLESYPESPWSASVHKGQLEDSVDKEMACRVVDA